MEFELFKQLGEFGLLGVILSLVWWIAVRLWRDLQMSWQERLAENKHIISVIQNTNSSYDALAAATENRARANELASQAQAVTSKTLEAQIKEVEKMVVTNEKMLRSVDRLIRQLERQWQDLTPGRKTLEEQGRSRGSSR